MTFTCHYNYLRWDCNGLSVYHPSAVSVPYIRSTPSHTISEGVHVCGRSSVTVTGLTIPAECAGDHSESRATETKTTAKINKISWSHVNQTRITIF